MNWTWSVNGICLTIPGWRIPSTGQINFVFLIVCFSDSKCCTPGILASFFAASKKNSFTADSFGHLSLEITEWHIIDKLSCLEDSDGVMFLQYRKEHTIMYKNSWCFFNVIFLIFAGLKFMLPVLLHAWWFCTLEVHFSCLNDFSCRRNIRRAITFHNL